MTANAVAKPEPQKPEPPKPAKPAAKKYTQCLQRDIKLAEQARNAWEVIVPTETTLDDVLIPGFFSLVAGGQRGIQRRDLIYVEPENGSWLAVLRVRDAGLNYATVSVLSAHQFAPLFPKLAADLPTGHRVEWAGAERKFIVIRTTAVDTKVLKEGFPTYAEAATWVNDLVARQ